MRLATFKTSFEYDILSSHAQALEILYRHESLTAGDLKTKLGFSFGAVTKIIDALETKKLVKRHKFTTADGRATEVFITPKGQKLALEMETVFTRWLEETLIRLSPENKKNLLKGIKTVNLQLVASQNKS